MSTKLSEMKRVRIKDVEHLVGHTIAGSDIDKYIKKVGLRVQAIPSGSGKQTFRFCEQAEWNRVERACLEQQARTGNGVAEASDLASVNRRLDRLEETLDIIHNRLKCIMRELGVQNHDAGKGEGGA